MTDRAIRAEHGAGKAQGAGESIVVDRVKVKICGLGRREDALLAAGAGADYLGVVLVPDTPRARTPEEARSLLEGIQLPSVIVVADLTLAKLVGMAERVGPSVIQLHGDESPEFVAELQEEGPWEVWKALRVRGPAEANEGLTRFGGVADGVLLDGWHPEQKGGTGSSFSWDEVAEVRDQFPTGMLFIAAGGLVPNNVHEAVAKLRPHVVDVSSGVEERPGVKSRALVETFIQNVRIASWGERL